MDIMKKKWHRYHYKNITYLVLSLIVAILLLKNESFCSVLFHLGNLEYIGAFVAGILFVSTFTVSIGSVILIILSESLHPIEIAIIAGLGAVVGDLTIFHFIRSKGFIDEIKHFFAYFGGDKISHLLHTKYFSWTLPVLGAIIIASPLPDELGVSLMGISKLSIYQFIFLSFLLNSIGIFIIISASLVLRL
jgi:hypothetical protein